MKIRKLNSKATLKQWDQVWTKLYFLMFWFHCHIILKYQTQVAGISRISEESYSYIYFILKSLDREAWIQPEQEHNTSFTLLIVLLNKLVELTANEQNGPIKKPTVTFKPPHQSLPNTNIVHTTLTLMKNPQTEENCFLLLLRPY